VKGDIHPFETDLNTIFRLSLSGVEPFEHVYRLMPL
jgi:hypothetical protein